MSLEILAHKILESKNFEEFEKNNNSFKNYVQKILHTIEPNINNNHNIIKNAFDIPGLWYIPHYLSNDIIKSIDKKIDKIKFEPITNSPNSRLVAHFGYRYSYDRSGVQPAAPIPIDLSNLVSMNDINNIIGEKIIGKEFDQLIINEYKPSQQISFHTDHTKQFGPIIACITIGESVPIKFKNGNNIKEINIETGSMYIMTLESRYQWQHSLKNNNQGTRYSLTFRTIQ
ncbi:2Og-Fe(II) oxygenase [Bandra megavirus]|uniref:2Og-Fe(II) oxygenase n=1 Tax=Bandra megavirus TaxID=2071566 RepID=A0A2K9V994_9VIRU|nr:2Og-Fe(II) oxygenase [Bandra megavirus]